MAGFTYEHMTVTLFSFLYLSKWHVECRFEAKVDSSRLEFIGRRRKQKSDSMRNQRYFQQKLTMSHLYEWRLFYGEKQFPLKKSF